MAVRSAMTNGGRSYWKVPNERCPHCRFPRVVDDTRCARCGVQFGRPGLARRLRLLGALSLVLAGAVSGVLAAFGLYRSTSDPTGWSAVVGVLFAIAAVPPLVAALALVRARPRVGGALIVAFIEGAFWASWLPGVTVPEVALPVIAVGGPLWIATFLLGASVIARR
jgi:hypothetical protein